jgi:hypothetical protein
MKLRYQEEPMDGYSRVLMPHGGWEVHSEVGPADGFTGHPPHVWKLGDCRVWCSVYKDQ